MQKYSSALGVKGEDLHVSGARGCSSNGVFLSFLKRVLPLLRDAAAAAHQHAGAGPVQHPEPAGERLHARNGQPAFREHHAGPEVHASVHAARLPQHQHGAQHQHHSGGAGGPLLHHGQEVSAGRQDREPMGDVGLPGAVMVQLHQECPD